MAGNQLRELATERQVVRGFATPENPMHQDHHPVVKAEMLIRRPAAEVFRAFTDPEITRRFWFTHSSGPLVAGARVRWDWRMYGASTEVHVLALEPGQRILIEWDDPPTRVEWGFTARADETTYVSITHSGFRGEIPEVTRQALDSMGGFSFVLAALKALLEHNIELHLVADHYPDAHIAGEGSVAG
jgi:uncharacterized protein YndB with AHSA1/START domain